MTVHVMESLPKKLNLKPGMTMRIFGLPDELDGLAGVLASVGTPVDDRAVADFTLGFLRSEKDIQAFAKEVSARTQGDAIIWACYPKKGSAHFTGEIHRDKGWAPMGEAGFEPVRQVAIDDSWSALRFRRVEFIKTMTRSFAMTEEGKAKSRPRS